MEKKVVNIFYLGIAQGESYKGGRKERRAGLPVKVLKHRPEYPGGYLEISYALLPEYGSRNLLTGKGKQWKGKVKRKILHRTLEKVKEMQNGSEWVISPSLKNNEEQRKRMEKSKGDAPLERTTEIPAELTAAHLHSYVPFDKVGVIFSEEGGTFEAREVILLLAPYLKRIRQVILVGENGPATELLAEYLYYEYGILPERCLKLPQKYTGSQTEMIWIETGAGSSTLSPTVSTSKTFAWINRQETLKFLDTAVKNGYNTES